MPAKEALKEVIVNGKKVKMTPHEYELYLAARKEVTEEDVEQWKKGQGMTKREEGWLKVGIVALILLLAFVVLAYTRGCGQW